MQKKMINSYLPAFAESRVPLNKKAKYFTGHACKGMDVRKKDWRVRQVWWRKYKEGYLPMFVEDMLRRAGFAEEYKDTTAACPVRISNFYRVKP